MKEKLLFVTKGGEDSEDGFSYVLELAKSLNAGIEMLMVHGKQAMETYEDMMAAVAFAEAGDHETVRLLVNRQQEEIREIEAKKIEGFAEKCREQSINFSCKVESGDAISAVKDLLRSKPNIEMVLLSPNISANKKILDFKKMLKQITRPVVSISRLAESEG
ncbi:MAG: hypothetical protein HY757_09915 [Nitrospirae bacterium]|nr:hypothetical protein [Nitrospirota bacterium]